jgi:hypothetical protein
MTVDRDLMRVLARAHPNVLIIGPVAMTDLALESMRPYLWQPIAVWTPREARDMPPDPYGTLVIRAIETLDRAQQSNLLARLEGLTRTVQAVSTAAEPLYPFVTRGDFLDSLYYHVNQVVVDERA